MGSAQAYPTVPAKVRVRTHCDRAPMADVESRTSGMTAFRTIKSLFGLTASGTVLAGLVALAAAAVLVLFVIPGGLGILTIEFERLKRWLRRACACLVRKNPPLKQRSL